MGPMSNVGVIESHFGQKLDAYKDQTGVIPEKISSAIAEVNVACLRRIVEAEAEEEGKVVDSDIDVKKLKNDVERWEASFNERQGSGAQTASSTGRSFGQTGLPSDPLAMSDAASALASLFTGGDMSRLRSDETIKLSNQLFGFLSELSQRR